MNKSSSAFLFFLFVSPALADDAVLLLPRKDLTPGETRSLDVEVVCRPGYSKSVRNTSRELKAEVYRKYGIKRDSRRYKIDHLIPLSIGGADTAANLWPSPLFPQPMNGRDKDRLEFRLYRLVCRQGYDIATAQREIAENWLQAFQKHCADPGSCPAFTDFMESIGKPVGAEKRK